MPPDPLQVAELLRRDISELRKDLSKLEKSLDKFEDRYSKEVTANLSSLLSAPANITKLTWLVVTSLIAVIFAGISLK